MTPKYHINLFQSEPDGASGLDREDLSTACKFLEPSLADASVQPKGGPLFPLFLLGIYRRSHLSSRPGRLCHGITRGRSWHAIMAISPSP